MIDFPWYKSYISIFKRILTQFNLQMDDLTITNEAPVYRINPVKFIWELRREDGLPYSDKDPNQQMYYAQLRNTFTTESDNKRTPSLKDNSNDVNK